MEEQFEHKATLLFKHDYFEDGLFGSLAIKPTADTRAMMHNLRMVSKPFTGGVHILMSQNSMFDVSKDLDPLRFELECFDPHYINYTELKAFEPAKDLLCFDNLNTVIAPDSSLFFLNDESFQGATEILRVQNNLISLVTYREEALYTFSRGNDDIIPYDFIEQLDITVNAFKFYNVPEGIIRVYENDVLVDMFYYKPTGVWNKPLGIVEIIPSILLEQYESHNHTVTYVIEFQVRKTHWKYICIQSREPYLKNLMIKQNAIEDDFKQSAADDTTTFISKLPIALSESPKNAYRLIQKSPVENVEDKTVIGILPNPSPHQLYPPEDQSYNAYFSHIYIYL